MTVKHITETEYVAFRERILNTDYSGCEACIFEIFDMFPDDIFGYYENGCLIGIIRFSEEDVFEQFDLESDDKITLIGALLVDPMHRFKRIGAKLVQYAVAHAVTIDVMASPFDESARRFFESIGFQPDEQEKYTDDKWELFFAKKVSQTKKLLNASL